MQKSLEKLVSIGSAAISSLTPVLDARILAMADAAADDLLELLRRKNGFYAFESALHIFPAQPVGKEIGLAAWNSTELWVHEYHGMADGCLFFAEDIFGSQFCIKENGIYSFDPETARCEFLASDLEGWARVIFDDYEVLTGYPLAHAWQTVNGALIAGVRLVPKTPFVAGGAFATENLYALESVKAMRFRANLAVQIRDLPDGAKIKWKLTD